MKIVDIKGKSNYVRFILDNGSYIKGNGELLVNGFCVYKDSLTLIINEQETPLSIAEKNELVKSVTDFLANKQFTIEFT